MRKTLYAFFAIVAITTATCAVIAGPIAQPVCCAHSIKRDIIKPYVEIRSEGGTGSGTVIRVGDEILILTAGHVVSDNVSKKPDGVYNSIGAPKPVTLHKDGSEDIQADVIYYSPPEEDGGHDLALLKPRNCTGLIPASVSLLKLNEGDDCWYIGTPMGLHQSLEKSIISIVDHRWDKNTYTVVNGCGTFGNSGGGLYVKDEARWVLVGVVCRTANSSPKHPLMCQTPETIADFIKAYKGSKK